MKKIKQTRFGDEGNCFAACIASMLDLSIDEVPDFANSDTHWLQAVDVWLWQRGLMLQLAIPDAYPKGCYYMAWGKSQRGYEHSVIYYEGKLAHDPHPGDSGLIAVDDIAYFVYRCTRPE